MRHVLRYLIIGLYNTLVGYLIFYLVNRVLGSVAHYLVTLGITYLFSITHAYLGQRYIVFRSTAPWRQEYWRFFLVNLGGMMGNALVLSLFVESGVEVMPAQAASVVIITALTYLGHRYFSFR